MTRVFYASPDPEERLPLLFEGTVHYTTFGVILLPDDDGEVGTYGEPDTRTAQETADLVPWHRVDYVEGYPR